MGEVDRRWIPTLREDIWWGRMKETAMEALQTDRDG